MERENGANRLKEWFVDRGITHVLFDMDGTLVDTRDHYRSRMHQYCDFLAKESGRDGAEIFDLFMDGIVSLRDEFQVRPAVLDVPARVLAKMCGVNGNELEEEIDKLMAIFEWSPEVLAEAVNQVRLVRDAGVDTVVVTHAGEDWTWKKRMDFVGLFKAWVCTRTDRPKDVVAWLGAVTDLDTSLNEVMVVGDGWESDIEPALEMGVRIVVWVRNGAEPRNDDRVIEIETIADLVDGLLQDR
ncbi:HAD family hydrolase [Patescibacteria group bacterium]|nr:HAD family hydrolase [Patescibacteria group bacterium]